MAEVVLQQAFKDSEDIAVSSAGLGALVDYDAADHAKTLMTERGLDLSEHKARQLTPAMISSSDLILVMESGHKRAIGVLDSTARGKIYRFCEWHDCDIPDPYGQPRAAFEDALALIDKGAMDWVKKIRT
jgi:protein-tyrosine phosphatase